MQTSLLPAVLRSVEGALADRILRSCVHCGFCNATCPTYQLSGDELDGPRGRIYLIKNMLEGQAVGNITRQHLGRCLQCGSCETTCPSGVSYGQLFSIGQSMIDAQAPPSALDRLKRTALLFLLPHRRRFAIALAVARTVRPLLPRSLKQKIPARKPVVPWPSSRHPRLMLRLQGCVHEALAPSIERAAAHVFDRIGITLKTARGCCGALAYHLGAHEHAKRQARRNLDRWLPPLNAGAEAATCTASGCTAFLKTYGELLAGDPVYADRAQKFVAAFKDPAEVLMGSDIAVLGASRARRIAFHAPCTLSHRLRLAGTVKDILANCGHTLIPVPEEHLCCGSAGS